MPEAPDYTFAVNQEFFIESLGGAKRPKSYLDKFPEAIYTKSLDSNLVALLYALLGPTGVASLRAEYLEARLKFEESGLSTVDLDAFYANPLGFARLAEEVYSVDPSGLLSTEQWQKIREADASYRNRAVDYLNAVRAGGTLQGITLAARSGLNMPVEVIENYRILYDHFSDDPLGLPEYGVTKSTGEVILLPRQNRPQNSIQEISFSLYPTEGNFTITFPRGNNSTTIELEFDSAISTVQKALEALPTIGKGNVLVEGGPLPDHPIEITFINDLADSYIPELIVTPVATGEHTMQNVNKELTNATVTIKQAGAGLEETEVTISEQNLHYAEEAINNIKPMTTIITSGKSPSVVKRQPFTISATDSSFTEVVRYVTGSTSVKWPERNSVYWIEANTEREAPNPQGGQRHHYMGFHNISAVTAYTDEALKNANYESSEWPSIQSTYASEHVGQFSGAQKALFPFLSEFQNNEYRFVASNCLANTAEPLIVENSVQGEGLINGIYPASYLKLPGVSAASPTPHFWSSAERTEGTDYLEFDLGSVRAVNYISFDISNKPFNIDLFYDLLDLSPERKFKEVTISDSQLNPAVRAVGYEAGRSNPWHQIEIDFTNSLGRPIFTRFLRLGFTRRAGKSSPFTEPSGNLLPFSVEVKNLRIGRNIA